VLATEAAYIAVVHVLFASGSCARVSIAFKSVPLLRELFFEGEPMKRQMLFLGAIFLLAGMSSTTIAQPSAPAAQSTESAMAQTIEPVEEVTVFAPFIVTRTVERGRPRSIPVSTINMSRGINFHDLDLTNDTDVATLETRVRQAADDICRELGRRFPRGRFAISNHDRNCAKNASDSALIEVREVVAAARGQ
jgi:UrcA family protein